VQTGGGVGKGVEDGQKGAHVVTPTPLHPFLTQIAPLPIVLALPVLGDSPMEQHFFLCKNFIIWGIFFEKKCFAAYSEINQNTFEKSSRFYTLFKQVVRV
jgi:hypothetical protein